MKYILYFVIFLIDVKNNNYLGRSIKYFDILFNIVCIRFI